MSGGSGDRPLIDHDGDFPLIDAPLRLWAVHIGGSDDLVACPDREAADRLKFSLEAADAVREANGLTPELLPRVVEWPYSPEAHAAQLANRDPHRGRKQPTVVPGSDTSFPDATDG